MFPNKPVLALKLVVEARPDTYKSVLVAAVPVAFWNVKLVRVVEAVEIKPLRKARVVEVACSLEESLVNGQAIPPALPQPVQEVTVRFPIFPILALKLVVEARLETYRSVVVAAVPVAF